MVEFDTKTAVEKIAEHLPDEKITASTVSGFLKKHPTLAPPKVLGRFYLWRNESVVALVKAWKQIKAGICLHCGKPWDGSEPETTTGVMPVATQRSSGGRASLADLDRRIWEAEHEGEAV